jgi:putative membrane protein
MPENTSDKKTAVPDANDMAIIRTTLALDRTLLAWVRTSLTLIGFGFTLARFVHDMMNKGSLAGMQVTYPRQIGLGLMAMGGAWEYISLRKKLVGEFVGPRISVSLTVAILLALLGTGMIIGLIFEFGT